MVGNDIVDLRLASKSGRWQSKRLWDKVFTLGEQKYLRKSLNADVEIWRLWSMKESAYKVYVQKYATAFFNPRRIECLINSETCGMVRIDEKSFFSLSSRFKNAVHTITTETEDIEPKAACQETDAESFEDMRKECYQKVLTLFSHLKNTNIESLKISKNELGVPYIYNEEKKSDVSLSISHHGRYYAFAFV